MHIFESRILSCTYTFKLSWICLPLFTSYHAFCHNWYKNEIDTKFQFWDQIRFAVYATNGDLSFIRDLKTNVAHYLPLPFTGECFLGHQLGTSHPKSLNVTLRLCYRLVKYQTVHCCTSGESHTKFVSCVLFGLWLHFGPNNQSHNSNGRNIEITKYLALTIYSW